MSMHRPLREVLAIAAVLVLAVVLTGSVRLAPAAGETDPDPVLVGAGDIATCPGDGDEQTAELVTALPDATVFTAGDNAYQSGTDAEFATCYDPSWGQFTDRTYPAPGNHDYNTPGATGYYAYFGDRAGPVGGQGYYSYDLGAWHVVVLNSNCAIVSCAVGSTQEQWLRADLAAHPTACTLAYWHHPRFSSGPHGNATTVQPFWQALYEFGADVVVNGHDHTYEVFAPQTPTGAADPTGIREFVIGTGGAEKYQIGTIKPNSVVRQNTDFGVLELTLHASSYDWQFLPVAGGTFTDSGTTDCNAGTRPTPPPPPSPNLLRNPGFEADANRDGRPDVWSTNTRFTRSTATTPHEGTYVGRHRATDRSTVSYTVGNVVPNLTAGRTYDVAGWVNVPPTTDAFTFTLDVTWRTGTNAVISRSTFGTVTASTQGAWQQFQAGLAAPAGTRNASVRMTGRGLNATIYVDDFSFRAR